MSCTYPTRGAKPAPFWHWAFCGECRTGRRADAIMAFALKCRTAETGSLEGLSRTLIALDLPHSIPRTRRTGWVRFGRRSLGTGAILGAFAGAAGFAWTRYIEIDPNISIPTFIMKGPNALEDFKRAGSLVKEPKIIDDMLKPASKVTPQIEVSGGTPGSSGSGGTMRTAGEPTPPPELHAYTLAEKEELVRSNAPALSALRQGLGKPYQSPPIRSINQRPEFTFSLERNLAQLLRLEAAVYAAKGRWIDSVNSGLDAMEFAVTTQQRAGTMERLYGNQYQEIGRAPLWTAVEHLSPRETLAAVQRLTAIMSSRPTFMAAVTEQKWVCLAGLQDHMRRPGWRSALNTAPAESSWGMYLALLPYSRRQIMNNAARYLDAQIAESKSDFAPYWQYRSQPEPPGDPVSANMAPAIEGFRVQDLVCDAESRLLLATMAIHAYRLENGRLPIGLTSLKGRYLYEIPFDPFRASAELTYRLTKTGYVLYSVGPDGRDDGGQPISNAGNVPEKVYIQMDSRGDIVAGVTGK